MGDTDLPSDSDSCDEDYIPEGAENDPVSEDESLHDSDEQEASEEDSAEKKKRKKTPRKRARKKVKIQEIEGKINEEKEVEKCGLSAADRKQKADALWADFLKDCDPPVGKKCNPAPSNFKEKSEKTEEKKSVKVVKEYEFAGEKVIVEKEVTACTNGTNPSPAQTSAPSMRGRGHGCVAGGGIASILGQMGKKTKLSTLEKSKLDWNSFKKKEGIEEDIERHNKGKNGYLERQDFLERADLRQFEIEKSLRATKRSSLR